MKHKLLSLVALAGALFMSTSAMAQWAEPEAVEPAMGAATTPEDGGVYFLYNPATNLYVGAGNHWGTHVVATTVSDAYPAVFWDQSIALSGAGDAMGNGQALPITLTKNEAGNYYLQHLGTNRGDRYLTSEDVIDGLITNSWIDGGTGRRIDFIITATEGGYTIQATNTVEQETYFGVDEGEFEHEDYDMVALNVLNNIPAGERAIWQFISTNYQAWQAYNARVKLYELYDEIQESAYASAVDASAAKAVYDNANATAEQIDAAREQLRLALNRAKFQDYFADASEENGIEIPDDVLLNPTFDNNVDGWFITVTGQNLGWQGRTDTNLDNGYSITNFIEAWIPRANGVLGNGVIAQTIYDLPQGKYVLELDATACHDPAEGDGSDIYGVYVFVQSGSREERTPVHTKRLGVTHFSVTFINQGDEAITFGLKVEDTNANWISADNFKITYYGKSNDTPELAILKSELKKAKDLLEELYENNIESYDDINISAEARNALTSAISDGESALSGDAAAQTAAAEAIKAAIEAVEASKLLYAQFKTIYNDGNSTLDRLGDANQWPDLQTEIDNFLADFESAFNAGSLTADDLEEYQNKVSQLVRDYISDPSKIKKGDDLTFLLVNPNFTTGTTADPTGWTINDGPMTELSLATKNIETFHHTFDLSQTIPNMPAGVYDVTLQGFARHDGTDTDKTWLYGGITKEFLISLNDDEEQMRDEPLYYDGSEERPRLHDGNYDVLDGTHNMYKANGMGGAYYWFQEINPNTGEPYYTNHVKVVLAEDGDLTIGIHCETGSDWVIFSNFGLMYDGQDMEIYYDMIDKKQKELSAILDENDPQNIADDVTRAAEELIRFNANNVETPQEALEKIAEIDESIAAVKNSIEVHQQVANVVEYLQSIIENLSGMSTDYSTLLDEAAANVDNGYPTVQAMRDDIQKLGDGWAAGVSQNIEAGEDATFVILNPHYTSLDETSSSDLFWTSDLWHGVDYFAFEFFNYLGDSPKFNHYQTLNGIKPGFYTVSVEGYHRYGDNNPNAEFGTPGVGHAHLEGTEELNAVMYVTTSVGSDGVALKSIFDGAQDVALGVGSEVEAEGMEGQFIPDNMQAASAYFDLNLYTNTLAFQVGEDGNLTIGIRKAQGIASDWTIFTDWKLFYHGTTAPDAVSSIEGQTTATTAIYGVDGRQQSQLRRGINIVRKSNGTIDKVLVK